jgi:hypothetical protein
MFFGRGKNKVHNPYTVVEIYDYYISDLGNNNLYYVEQTEYCNIIYDFYREMMNAIIRENAEFKMPYGIGELRVLKTRIKLNRLNILSVDWSKTVEHGKYIHHLNEHTNGFKYFFHWAKKKKRVKNLFYYKLVMTRENKRLLAKLIKTGKYDYFEK